MSILNLLSKTLIKTPLSAANKNILLNSKPLACIERVHSSGLAYVPDVAPAELGLK